MPDVEVELSNIWAEVLRARPPINDRNQTVSSLDGTNDAGSFESVNDSQKTSEGDESDEGEILMVIDHGPGVLSPGERQQERYRVDAAKNGMELIFNLTTRMLIICSSRYSWAGESRLHEDF